MTLAKDRRKDGEEASWLCSDDANIDTIACDLFGGEEEYAKFKVLFPPLHAPL